MADILGIKKRIRYFKRISLKKAALYAAIPVLYVYLPFHSAFNYSARPFLLLFIFYAVNSLIIFLLSTDAVNTASKLRYECEDIESRMNIETARNGELIKQNISLKGDIERYSSLKKVIEEINRELDPDPVCESLCEAAFSLVGGRRGNCILYLADKEAQCLRLFKARKQDAALVIKAKQGDIFDRWVMVHMNPLLVEDIHRDFRFDPDQVNSLDSRPVGSLISSPLISGSDFLGVLRLEHPDPGSYGLDDLRFLRSISDLGALAIENAQLYKSTQELAVHDGLTGVFTKGYFLELLVLEVRRCLRSRKQFGLLMIDIDFFKAYNDTYGHSAGDIVLKAIAGRISALMAERGGIVCRFGGEEFCALIPDAGRAESAEAAKLLCGAIARETFILRRKATSVTVSVGAAVFPDSASDDTGMLMKADKAMYGAKQSGRNCAVTA
jgi:diguanylate cyclase (GGDEF)-like protein